MTGSRRNWIISIVLAAALTAALCSSHSVRAQYQAAQRPRHIPAISNAHRQPGASAALSASMPTVSGAVTSGTWTPLNNQPDFFPQNVFLLTDGRVLAQGNFFENLGWWTLTPDDTGSYVNGNWTEVASPPHCPNGYPGASADTVYSPLYYASAVLPDGRFVMLGGEYNFDYDYVLNDGSGEVWTDQGAIYDPVANSWTCVAPPSGWTQVGDAQSVVLADGTFMVADPFDNEVATLNAGTNPPTFNSPFTPSGKSADDFNDEEGWTLLPNGTVLTLEIYNANDGTETPALAYDPSSQRWDSAGIAPDPLVNLENDDSDNTPFYEIGPATLRADGTVFAEGGNGLNDIYDSNNGAWSRGPSFPMVSGQQLEAADAPAVLLPDGNVLVDASPIYNSPSEFFEFDGANLSQVAAPPNAPSDTSYFGRLLMLPTGQALFTDYSNDVEIYTPSGSPNSSWAPTISNSPAQVFAGGKNYPLAGTQFNGLSQAVMYGDDYQGATNYPLVRIINNASNHVFYCRTHDHSTMAVATGSTSVSTEFDVPSAAEQGASSLEVVANGIASQAVPIMVVIPTTLKAAPSKINFGSVDATGASKPKRVTLINTGAADAVIAAVTTTAPFAIAGGPNTCSGAIAPRKKCTFDIEFAPTTVADVTGGSIDVTYNGINPRLALSGDGVAATLRMPTKTALAGVAPGVTGKPKNIAVTNRGTVPVALEMESLGGNDPGSFKITNDGCSGQPLAPKRHCIVGVEFAPPMGASGSQTATLSYRFTYGANAGSVSTTLSSAVK